MTVDRHAPANHLRIATESAPPERFRYDDDRGCRQCVIRGLQGAAKTRPRPHDRKVIRRHDLGVHRLGEAFRRQRNARAPPRGQVAERGLRGGEIVYVRPRQGVERSAGRPGQWVGVVDVHDFVNVPNLRRAQQRPLNQRVDRRRHPDAHGERDDGERGEGRGRSQAADGEHDVAQGISHARLTGPAGSVSASACAIRPRSA